MTSRAWSAASQDFLASKDMLRGTESSILNIRLAKPQSFTLGDTVEVLLYTPAFSFNTVYGKGCPRTGT